MLCEPGGKLLIALASSSLSDSHDSPLDGPLLCSRINISRLVFPLENGRASLFSAAPELLPLGGLGSRKYVRLKLSFIGSSLLLERL